MHHVPANTRTRLESIRQRVVREPTVVLQLTALVPTNTAPLPHALPPSEPWLEGHAVYEDDANHEMPRDFAAAASEAAARRAFSSSTVPQLTILVRK